MLKIVKVHELLIKKSEGIFYLFTYKFKFKIIYNDLSEKTGVKIIYNEVPCRLSFLNKKFIVLDNELFLIHNDDFIHIKNRYTNIEQVSNANQVPAALIKDGGRYAGIFGEVAKEITPILSGDSEYLNHYWVTYEEI